MGNVGAGLSAPNVGKLLVDGPGVTESSAEKKSPAPAAASAAPRSGGALAKQWSDWIAQKGSFLTQFGVDMLQPPAPGQSLAGQVGSAFGSGMEAADRQKELARSAAQQERENSRAERKLSLDEAQNASESELRSAQAGYYRAGGKRTSIINEQLKKEDSATKNVVLLGNLWAKLKDAADLSGDEEDKAAADEAYQEYLSALKNRRSGGSADSPAAGPLPLPSGVTSQSMLSAVRGRIASGAWTREMGASALQKYGLDPSGL